METELERMIIRLIGDGSSYRGMMTQAQADTKQGASAIEQGAGKAGKSWSEAFGISKEGLTSFISSAGSLIGGISLGGFLSEAKSAYADQIAAEKQLGAILKVNGREVDTLMESYKSFANEMQSQTGVADENVLALLRQAETLGATGEQAQRVVKNYLGMEAAGIPLRGGLRALIGLEQGHSEMLKMTFPELRNITNASERTARAQVLLGNTFELARLEGQKGSTRLRVAWNELMEDFGKTAFELAKPITEIKALFVEWLASLSPFTKQTIVMFAWITAGALTFWGTMSLGASIFNMLTGGIFLVIGLAAVAAVAMTSWIDRMGGIGKAWESIKNAGMIAWTSIKQAAMAFWTWIKPAVDAGIAWMVASWEWVKVKAGEAWGVISVSAILAWDWIKQTAIEFWTWAKPYILRGIYSVVFAWQYISSAAVEAWDTVYSYAEAVIKFISDNLLEIGLAVGIVTSAILIMNYAWYGGQVAVIGFNAAVALAGTTFNVMTGGTVLLVGLIITGLIAATWAVYEWIQSVGGAGNAWELLKDYASDTLGFIVDAWNWVKDAVIVAFNLVADNWELALAVMFGPIGMLVAYVINNWEKVESAAAWAWGLIKDNWDLLVAGIVIAAGPIFWLAALIIAKWDWVSAAFWYLLDVVISVWNGIMAVASPVFTWLVSAAGTAIEYVIAGFRWLSDTAGAVWTWIKTKAAEFWDWISPVMTAWWDVLSAIFDVAMSTATEMWDVLRQGANIAWTFISDVAMSTWEVVGPIFTWIKDAATTAWDFILENWKLVVAGIIIATGPIGWTIAAIVWAISSLFENVNWDTLRATIIDVMLKIEYGVRNLKPVWELVVAAIAYRAVKLSNELAYIFTEALPAGMRGFFQNFQAYWTAGLGLVMSILHGIKNNFQQIFSAMGTGLRSFLRNPSGGLTFDFGRLLTVQDITNGFNNAFARIPPIAIPARVEGKVEAELRRDFEQRQAQLQIGFEEFRSARLAANLMAQTMGLFGSSVAESTTQAAQSWGWMDGAADALVNDTAGAAGNTAAMAGAMGDTASKMKEMKELSATSLFSADALAKVEKQMEMINKSPTAGSNRDAAIEDGAEGMQRLQREGNGFLSQMARRDPVVLQPAGL